MQMPIKYVSRDRRPGLRGWLGLRRCLVLALVLLAALASPARAGFDEARAAYERGEYRPAFREFLSLALAGDPFAQGIVGSMYSRGEGVPRDYAEAARWYRRAAKAGVAPAQYSIGSMYQNGRGVAQDYTEAAKWFRRAAEQGDGLALGKLGILYGLGQGVPQDYVLAYTWLSLAAARLTPGSDRDVVLQVRRIAAEELSPAQFARAQHMVRDWRPKFEMEQ